MNILCKEIEHVRFGKGKVIGQEADRLSIEFSQEFGTKQFVYPDAFEKYLKLHDPHVEAFVLEELHAKQAHAEAEKIRKQQEYEAIAQSRASAKALLAPKRKSSQASKPKKKSS